jgi:hypothetical protein
LMSNRKDQILKPEIEELYKN